MSTERTGPDAPVRALPAVALLAGLPLLAAAVLLGLAGVNAALVLGSDRFHPWMVKLWLLSAVVGYPVLRVVLLARRPRPAAAAGPALSREAQPALWARVDAVAAAAGVRGPAELRLVPEPRLAVVERTALLGLLPGRRTLLLGAPLLLGLSAAELDALLARELGRFAGNGVRLGPVVLSGHDAVGQVVAALHLRADRHRAAEAGEIAEENAYRVASGRPARAEDPGRGGVEGVLARLFGAYARLYGRVSARVRERQEYAADRLAAELAGRDTAVAALGRADALAPLHAHYLEQYVGMGLEADLLPLPGQVVGGFAHLLAAPRRAAELDEAVRRLPRRTDEDEDEDEGPGAPPSLHRRLAALLARPDAPARLDPPPPGPAAALLADAERQFTDLEAAVPAPGGARRVDWPELVDGTLRARERGKAQPVLRALTGTGRPGTVEALLDVLDAGRGEEIARLLPRSERAAAATGRAAREFRRPLLREALRSLTMLALYARGAARWEASWSGPAFLVLPGGTAERLPGALDAAVADTPDSAPLRALLAEAAASAATPA
ncbi:M48 family metallopeptidase [Kitasatospora saccharophila]|uniref:M48 family metallopeptidase n=1 Tax=Kitasatospora saccharophila TaxID=407973 RepID=A0ABN2X554_9ACTN